MISSTAIRESPVPKNTNAQGGDKAYNLPKMVCETCGQPTRSEWHIACRRDSKGNLLVVPRV